MQDVSVSAPQQAKSQKTDLSVARMLES